MGPNIKDKGKEQKVSTNIDNRASTEIMEYALMCGEVYEYVDEGKFDDHDAHENKFFIDRKKKPMRAKNGKSIKKQRLMKCPRR